MMGRKLVSDQQAGAETDRNYHARKHQDEAPRSPPRLRITLLNTVLGMAIIRWPRFFAGLHHGNESHSRSILPYGLWILQMRQDKSVPMHQDSSLLASDGASVYGPGTPPA